MMRTIMSILLVLIMTSCATLGNKQKQNAKIDMQTAFEFSKNGDHYNALLSALNCLDSDPNNPDCSNHIKKNYLLGINQEVNRIKSKLPENVAELATYQANVDILLTTQKRLTEYKFITNKISPSELENPDFFQTAFLRDLNNLITRNDIANLEAQIKLYKNLNLPANNDFIEIINNSSLLFLDLKEYDLAMRFLRENIKLIKDSNKKKIIDALYSLAEYDVQNNQKKKGLGMFIKLSELDKENAVILNQINKLRNELLTMFSILDLENDTSEIVSINNNEFARLIKNNIDNIDNLTEVIDHDKGLDKLKNMCSDVDGCYNYLKKQKELDIVFDNNIRYLIVPKIKSFKIQRRDATMRTTPFNWDFSSGRDGNGFLVGLEMFSAYGKYKVNYFQCDVYSEKVVGQVIMNLLVYDMLKKKVILEDRLQLQTEDSATWGENPTAVGIVNKIPATYYPSAMKDIINSRRSTKSDDEITKDLQLKAVNEICNKIKKGL